MICANSAIQNGSARLMQMRYLLSLNGGVHFSSTSNIPKKAAISLLVFVADSVRQGHFSCLRVVIRDAIFKASNAIEVKNDQ
jgi:hypothetical protein